MCTQTPPVTTGLVNLVHILTIAYKLLHGSTRGDCLAVCWLSQWLQQQAREEWVRRSASADEQQQTRTRRARDTRHPLQSLITRPRPWVWLCTHLMIWSCVALAAAGCAAQGSSSSRRRIKAGACTRRLRSSGPSAPRSRRSSSTRCGCSRSPGCAPFPWGSRPPKKWQTIRQAAPLAFLDADR